MRFFVLTVIPSYVIANRCRPAILRWWQKPSPPRGPWQWGVRQAGNTSTVVRDWQTDGDLTDLRPAS